MDEKRWIVEVRKSDERADRFVGPFASYEEAARWTDTFTEEEFDRVQLNIIFLAKPD